MNQEQHLGHRRSRQASRGEACSVVVLRYLVLVLVCYLVLVLRYLNARIHLHRESGQGHGLSPSGGARSPGGTLASIFFRSCFLV